MDSPADKKLWRAFCAERVFYTWIPEKGVELHETAEDARQTAASAVRALQEDGQADALIDMTEWGLLIPLGQAACVERIEPDPFSEDERAHLASLRDKAWERWALRQSPNAGVGLLALMPRAIRAISSAALAKDPVRRAEILTDQLYWMMFRAGIGAEFHAFIEWCGVLNEYLRIVRDCGVDPQALNRHTQTEQAPAGYQLDYLAEKLHCILAPFLRAASRKDVERFLRIVHHGG
jgi:hypothetical protein